MSSRKRTPDNNTPRAASAAAAQAHAPVVEFPTMGELPLSDRWRIMLLPLALMAAAFLLRFIGLGWKDLWFDEVQSLWDIRYPRPEGQSHWLFFRIMALVTPQTGDPTWAVRLYPALTGVLAVPVLYDLVRRLAGSRAALIAAGILTIQPFHLFYSQEARYYAPMVLFAALALHGAVLFLTTRHVVRWLGLLLCAAASWVGVQHQPTFAPFALAVGAAVYTILGFSAFGAALWQRMIPALRRSWIIAAATVLPLIGGAAVLLLKPGAVMPMVKEITSKPWGETKNVELTADFFARHFSLFGWDFTALPLPTLIAGLVNLLLFGAGVWLLARQWRWSALLIVLPFVAMFLAIFAISRPNIGYLDKYSCALLPLVLAAVAAPLALLSTRHRLAGPAVAGVLVLGLLPGAVGYYRGEKMPFRPLLAHATAADPDASIFLYGHMGYQAALYAADEPVRSRIEYFTWRRQGDAGQLEQHVLAAAASSGKSAYFLTAWDADMPAPMTAYLAANAELVHRVPSIVGPEQEGRLYRFKATTPQLLSATPTPAIQVAEFDRFRRPAVTENGALDFSEAASVEYAIDLPGGSAWSLDVAVDAAGGRPWILGARTGDDPYRIAILQARNDGPTTMTVVVTPSADARRLTLTSLSDYPEVRDPKRRLIVRALSLSPLEGVRIAGPPFADEPKSWPAPGLAGWTINPPALVENSTGIDGMLSARLGGPYAGSIAGGVVPAKPGELAFLSVRLVYDDLYGVGGNVTLLPLNAQGAALQQGYLSNRSWESYITWAPIENLFLWKERGLWFETVRPLPAGTASVAVAFPFWKVDGNRQYATAANRWLVHPYTLVTRPQTTPGLGR